MLRPFWRYYGGKWRASAAGAYPAPSHDTIVEPFAGAAGYSLVYGAGRRVVLIEKYPTVAAIWRWLITADPELVRAIPEVDDVDHLPAWVPQGARFLVGFLMTSVAKTPCRRITAEQRRRWAGYRKVPGWTPAMRERVAKQVTQIRNWEIIEGDYTLAPDVEATWFIDSPYQTAGRGYVHGSRKIDYSALAEWCRARRGQRIVCENVGASWLPFRAIGKHQAGPQSREWRSAEAVWP